MDKLLYTMISKIHELEPEAQQTTNEVSITLVNSKNIYIMHFIN